MLQAARRELAVDTTRSSPQIPRPIALAAAQTASASRYCCTLDSSFRPASSQANSWQRSTGPLSQSRSNRPPRSQPQTRYESHSYGLNRTACEVRPSQTRLLLHFTARPPQPSHRSRYAWRGRRHSFRFHRAHAHGRSCEVANPSSVTAREISPISRFHQWAAGSSLFPRPTLPFAPMTTLTKREARSLRRLLSHRVKRAAANRRTPVGFKRLFGNFYYRTSLAALSAELAHKALH